MTNLIGIKAAEKSKTPISVETAIKDSALKHSDFDQLVFSSII